MSLDFSLSEAFGFDFEGEEPDFSIKDFGLAGKHDGIENQRYLQPRIYESIGQKLLFEHACDMVSGLRLEPGMRLLALVSGYFIFGDAIEAMVTELGLEIRRMTHHAIPVGSGASLTRQTGGGSRTTSRWTGAPPTRSSRPPHAWYRPLLGDELRHCALLGTQRERPTLRHEVEAPPSHRGAASRLDRGSEGDLPRPGGVGWHTAPSWVGGSRG